MTTATDQELGRGGRPGVNGPARRRPGGHAAAVLPPRQAVPDDSDARSETRGELSRRLRRDRGPCPDMAELRRTLVAHTMIIDRSGGANLEHAYASS